ncbi:MAG: alpha/beta hydrolase, partial [Vallitaleaceae bacterium]|nr:alpha/beta hydrolase [Vallitaleaceae bacterium]
PLEELVPIQLEYVKGTMTSISSEEQAYFDAIYADLALLEDLDGLSNSQAVMGAYKAYWTDLATYEPLVLVQDIEVPLLILQGERDYQVTMTDFNLWQEALVDKPNVSFISFEKLNHLLMAGEGPSTPTEYTIPNHVDLALINEIVSFIKNN